MVVLAVPTQETLRIHPIATGLPRVALKDDVIPLAHPIVSSTGETVSEIPIKAGQVLYASFAGYQRYARFHRCLMIQTRPRHGAHRVV